MSKEEWVTTGPRNGATVPLPDNYAFVMNVWHLLDRPVHTLAPGHELRRATPEEITTIKETLERLVGGPVSYQQFFWEHRWPHRGSEVEILPEAEWRYFVIGFRGNNQTISELQAAFDLALVELEVGFTILYHIGGTPGKGFLWWGGRLFHVLEAAWHSDDFFVDVSARDTEAIAEIHTAIQHHEDLLVDVKRLAGQLGDLKALPHQSPLRFLGYFAILESLLTHAPKLSDPYDSITRQVKKKLALLDHRWPAKIDYTPFAGASTDTVWSKMYRYRSQLAHGGAPDFAGELATLGSQKKALKLLNETVKAVIRQALTEPQLVVDLRDC